MKTVLLIRPTTTIRTKRVTLDLQKHVVVAGFLCDKDTMKQIGLIVRIVTNTE